MFSSVCLFRREAAISLEMPVMYIHSIAAYWEPYKNLFVCK